MRQAVTVAPELLGEQPLTITQVARVCRIDEAWLVQRVTTGVLQPDLPDEPSAASPANWRFSVQTLVRARRIAELERTYDADPELAALTADLMDEVRALRHALQRHLHGLEHS